MFEADLRLTAGKLVILVQTVGRLMLFNKPYLNTACGSGLIVPEACRAGSQSHSIVPLW